MDKAHAEYKSVTERVFGQESHPSFTPKRVKQHEYTQGSPLEGSSNTNLVWKLTNSAHCKMGAAQLVRHLQAHPALQGWSVELLPPQPLSFLATANNIVSLVRQLRSTGQNFPDRLFCLPPRAFEL
jgi:hypothetical protein